LRFSAADNRIAAMKQANNVGSIPLAGRLKSIYSEHINFELTMYTPHHASVD